MATSFFLKYASFLKPIDIKKLLVERWDLDFIEHESCFFGIYFRYSGLYADNITIKNNCIDENTWLIDSHKNYSAIIEISFTGGKKKDKKSKVSYMKNIMKNIEAILITEKEL